MIIDVQIVSDNADLGRSHKRKQEYYDTNDIKAEAKDRLATHHPVEVHSATLNWRGCWAKESVVALKKLKLTDHQLAQVALRVMEATYSIYKVFRSTGARFGSPRRWRSPAE